MHGSVGRWETKHFIGMALPKIYILKAAIELLELTWHGDSPYSLRWRKDHMTSQFAC